MVATAQGNCLCISVRSTLSRQRDLMREIEVQLGEPVRHSPLLFLPCHSLETPSHLHPPLAVKVHLRIPFVSLGRRERQQSNDAPGPGVSAE